jgi:hypothetical protein
MSQRRPEILNFPKIEDPRGNLSFVEAQSHIPFEIARTYWVYDVPGGETRGSHAFKIEEEVLIALSGSFDVVLNDGRAEKTFSLNRSYFGLYVPALTWRTLVNFSTNSFCLVLSSSLYDEGDYIRDYDEFLETVKHEK